MRLLLTFLALLFFLSATTQTKPDKIELIRPIIETEPMSLIQSKIYASKTYRNWTIEALGLDTIITPESGKGTKVCICDTGRPTHQSLRYAIEDSANFTTDKTDEDGNEHSTHIAGIINEIVPSAKLLFAKVLSDDGWGGEQQIMYGINWCVMKKADVINLSLGGSKPMPKVRKAIQEANKQGIHVVAAAGNEGSSLVKNTIGYPARYKETITIGSIDHQFNVSSFSSSGSEGDIVTGGQNILSTGLNNQYRVMSGTSMSAPFVSATIALAKSQGMTYDDTRMRLIFTAQDMLTEGHDPLSFYGHYTPNFHAWQSDTTETIQPEPTDPVTEKENGFSWWYLVIPFFAILFMFFELGLKKK